MALHHGYRSTARYDGGPAIGPDGLRARVGARHLPLGVFVQAFLDTGFRILRLEELGAREFPYVVALSCRTEAAPSAQGWQGAGGAC